MKSDSPADLEDRIIDSLIPLVEGEFLGNTEQELPIGRRAARTAAVQALYESDLTGHPAKPAAQRLAKTAGLSCKLCLLAASLAEHAEGGRETLDQRIQMAAPLFPTSQIAIVDRNVLRVALTELEIYGETPVEVVFNEAIEIARLLGSHQSPAFVNGVLASMLESS